MITIIIITILCCVLIKIVSYALLNTNLRYFYQCGDPLLCSLFRPEIRSMGPFFRPDTQAWILCSDQGLKHGSLVPTRLKHVSFVQTWDSNVGPMFITGTQTWVLCSDQALKRGSYVQTWNSSMGLCSIRDSSMGPLFKPGTQAWIFVQLGTHALPTRNLNVVPLFKPGT